ncbi:hypothetical protein GGE46_005734 [Rhizobium etli]|uniref:Uncharacterized protein n=1 Tax=Rhizobium etli TaxID=29449 RepID=A0A7W6YAN4_RHIET|nr:hypothetical protein [Rhizobium etli]MBB4538943.1 hypothetical protein [Rhizobium etli]
MAIIEQRLAEMGLELPEPLKVRDGLLLPFVWVRMRGARAYISGHVACNRDGTLANPLGKVGAGVSPEQGYASARLVALAPSRQPQAGSRRPRSGHGLAARLRHGECCSRFQ